MTHYTSSAVSITIAPHVAAWVNRHLPAEALWDLRPVFAAAPPYGVVAYDAIVTGDRPPQAARGPTPDVALRRVVLRYTHKIHAHPRRQENSNGQPDHR